ncbi:MAG: hypothetical protein KAT65_03495 [Methanophagales archaeon]|nr:hypothetical protein [Methanophagales archaeon]
MSERKRDKKGRSVLASGVVICIVAAFIGSSGITGLASAALQAEDTVTVTVTVNAPEYVEETFNVTIDVDNVTNLNSGQFDLSFDSSVVNVTDVRDGEIDGVGVLVEGWSSLDADKVRVLVKLPDEGGEIGSASGSGYLAEIEFEVKGGCSEKSTLMLSNGLLVNTEAEEIEAEWYGDEVTVFCPTVTVDAPEYVTDTFNAIIRIEDVTELNSGQFDLSFNSSVVNVTDVRDGEIGGVGVLVEGWSSLDADTVRVLVKLPDEGGEIGSASGSGYLAEIAFDVKGRSGDKSALDLSDGLLVNTEAEEIGAEWYDGEVTVVAFDTGEGTYPSIFGTHEGTITPSEDIVVHKIYTYPCAGTGGHSEYVKIENTTWSTEATWGGYTGDYHNIVFSEPFTLYAGETYNYIIKTGSYPQIVHETPFDTTRGTITCSEFTDANGKIYYDWIPAIRLW